jgi:hypothetical protein
MEITVSELYEFKSCPLRYKFTKVDKTVSEITENDGLREAMRSTISYFYYQLYEGRLISFSELKEKFGSMWYGNLGLFEIKANSKKSQRDKELKAIGMLQSFYRKQKYAPDIVVAVNLDFRVPFGDNFFVRGTIPVIREMPIGMEVVNFKTGSQRYDEFWQATDMELTFQAMGYESIFKKEADSICVENLSGGKTIYPERRRKDYKRLYKSITMMKKTIDEGWYYPRESYHCDQCPAQNLCMEWR